MNRLEISNKYAQGSGLEIAPFHNPWPTHLGITSMFYIDLFTNDQLREQYPEHKNDKLCRVDILDDGQFCNKFKTDHFDFLFSSHVLEHCPQVIETVRNWLRVVKVGGYVIMAIPLKHNPIDKDRNSTSFSHLMGEFNKGEANHYLHYLEYFNIVDNLFGEELIKRVHDSIITKPHIHFHCWEAPDLGALFFELSQLTDCGFKVSMFQTAGHEAFVVLQKTVSGDLKWK